MLPKKLQNRRGGKKPRLQTVFSLAAAALAVDARLAAVPTMDEVIAQIEAGNVDAANADRLERLKTDRAAFIANIAAHGIKEPLKVIRRGSKWFLVDGRNRYQGAVAAGLTRVPCIRVEDEEVAEIIASTVIGRRHWTKSMKAYLAVKTCPEVVNSKPGRPGNSNKVGVSRGELAAQYGVSDELINQACELMKRCYHGEQLTAAGKLIEPKVWLGASLGGLIAGLGGVEANPQGEPRRPSTLTGAETALRSLWSRLQNFSEWTPEDRAGFRDQWRALWRGEATDNSGKPLPPLPEDVKHFIAAVAAESEPAPPAEAPKAREKKKPASAATGLLRVTTVDDLLACNLENPVGMESLCRKASAATIEAAIAQCTGYRSSLRRAALEMELAIKNRPSA